MALAAATLAFAGSAGSAGAQAGKDKPKPPYFASISAGKARMRSGPGRTFPATWLYVRPDLPIRVVDVFKEWRKVEDPGGTQGWMLGALVSGTRTAIVQGSVVELRERPAYGARVLWRAEPGVVGRVSQCARGWCRFDVKGQAGYAEATRLWGVTPDETLP
ncbi:SH3 domain-containing protein [Sphingomonas sp. TZW2008]|uniref:SH3 domain-containing protein n=1 Tax=Sphingomonas sp. TZW2008 TaxID=1917973 RepID=UPI00211A134B|nr:SH3 domain-containing protein [Sphingomonas sp. TZW2008]